MPTKPIRHESHPPWTDMITECITSAPDGTRDGVSRPAIKKFVDSKYHLAMNTVTASQLNRAIADGTDTGRFLLPKGPSGKVKLAPKKVGEIAPEERKASLRGVRLTEAKGTTKRVSTTKSKISSFAEEQPSKTVPMTRKYTSMAKKARVTPSRRQAPTRKTTKRGSGELALTSSSTKVKTRSATRGAGSKKRAAK